MWPSQNLSKSSNDAITKGSSPIFDYERWARSWSRFIVFVFLYVSGLCSVFSFCLVVSSSAIDCLERLVCLKWPIMCWTQGNIKAGTGPGTVPNAGRLQTYNQHIKIYHSNQLWVPKTAGPGASTPLMREWLNPTHLVAFINSLYVAWRPAKCPELQAVLEERIAPSHQHFEVDGGGRQDAADSDREVCRCELGRHGSWAAGTAQRGVLHFHFYENVVAAKLGMRFTL